MSESRLHRCLVCLEPFVSADPDARQCVACERDDLGRLEAWERSLRIQRALRDRSRLTLVRDTVQAS